MLAVTGITGHTGRYFVDTLIENHYSDTIRCLIHNSSKAAFLNNSGLSVEMVNGTLDSDDDLRKLLSGVDTVLHIANIHYSPRILRIGRECGVTRFILVHTTGVFSKFKAASEEYIAIEKDIMPLMDELNITILRPTMIFGDLCDHNISKFIRLIHRLPVVPAISGGRSRLQPVNARDLGKAYYQALISENTSGKAYNLSGQRPVTIRELYTMIGRFLGKKIWILPIPMWLGVFGAMAVKCVSLGKIDLVEKVQRMGEDRSYSHEDAAMDFGFQPEPFEDGLKREVQAYLAKT